MAQTKTSPRRRSSSGSSRSRPTGGTSKARSTSRSSSGRNGSPQRKQASATPRSKRGATRTANGQGKFDAVTETVSSGAETVSSGAQNAAQGVAGVVKKAKTPLIAGGAAIAGLAGAAVLNSARSRRRKVLGVKMPRGNGLKVDARKVAGAVTDAAKRADQFGQRVSSVANSVQTVSETADKAAKKA
jgi:uncharacterized phage infection (PIP) family protein YhgE